MTGAMYAAIGGLKSHMTKLNVIGNNVANVNTYGYKAQRITFKESIYTTSRSGSNGGVTLGGNNPSQIGYGCSVGSIDLNMSPSTYAPTGVGLDCMLTGEGFFMVGDKIQYEINDEATGGGNAGGGNAGGGNAGTTVNRTINGHGITSGDDLSQMSLTRVGDFWVDADGYICNRDNKVLYGFARVQNPKYIPNPTAEQLKADPTCGDKTIISTELVPLRVPLSAAAPTKDNGGYIPAEGTEGDPNYKAEQFLWEEGDPVYPYLNANKENRYAYYDDGEASPITEAHTDPVYASQIAVAQNTNKDRVSDELVCQLKNMAVGTDGSITGTAANGETVVIGYVAIASVDSPDGVTHEGGAYYKCQPGAGGMRVSALVDLPTSYLGNQEIVRGTGNDPDQVPKSSDAILFETKNKVQNGGLEASSTDVATEFSEMILTQRGYQANTRIVTVTDSMLEELVNMKR